MTTTNLSTRFRKLRDRRRDPRNGAVLLKEARFDGVAETPSAASQYLAACCAPIEREYTDITIQQCESVQSRLDSGLSDLGVEFDRQGSVTNDTHIKSHSDVDLLVLTRSFIYLKPPLVPSNPFTGDPVAELVTIRDRCEKILKDDFPAASIDIAGSKSVSLQGGPLTRKVDVVPAAWLDTPKYRESRNKTHRGIQVLDRSQRSVIENFPFLHNELIDQRDQARNGDFRRLVRAVKSIRSDAEPEISVSSYDIVALCYALPANEVTSDIMTSLYNFCRYCLTALTNTELKNKVQVPNGMRTIFPYAKEAEVQKLVTEVLYIVKLAASR